MVVGVPLFVVLLQPTNNKTHAISDKNVATSFFIMGYDAGILYVEYQVKPKYEQYMQITTTNANTNGQIIPFAVLGINIGNNPYTVNNFASKSNCLSLLMRRNPSQ